MVKFASTLLLATIFGAFASAQPIGFKIRNYNEVNPDNNVVVVTVTKTLQAGEKNPEQQQPQYDVETPAIPSEGLPDTNTGYQTVPAPPPVIPTPAPETPITPDGWHGEMLNQLNAIRAEVGKAPVTLDQRLQDMAQAHSESQGKMRMMTHVDAGGTLGERFTAAKIAWRGTAENIAWNQKTVSDVMTSWKNSPKHYANMVGDFNCVGFGVANFYWTQDFLKV
ncbi:SCP-domain-containing protein [Coemansia reversa NRRL 1564]|uniref:SCP-domain-containing protein n=1 Tax=Coemansia reversa (strain ATCC 12441 / NRRL 1564) TaxID=763665 RepID=A0A2G5B745_COERN|nr:SCP-domain-containing protein [Coemansia reversa NRRL 1564]|eukprot:PIA14821.1 SCP-domain-containing protein [Coemansia reversa NRRL 1564]